MLCFEVMYGLKANLEKKCPSSMGDVENVEQLAHELGCKVGALPSTYLGIPLGARHHAVSVWEEVEERFQKRLTSWKRQSFSKGGRLTLIRSMLSNLPIYLLSLFKLPKTVKGRVKRIQRNFLGGVAP